MRTKNTRLTVAAISAACGGLLCVGTAQAQLFTVSPTKGSNLDVSMSGLGDYVAGRGISPDNFLRDSNGGVSVYLKARNRPNSLVSGPNGQAMNVSGNTFINPTDTTGAMMQTPTWSFDFQFTPRSDDVVDGRNYTLSLLVDSDPGPGTDFTTNRSDISHPIFDADMDDDLIIEPGSLPAIMPVPNGAGSWDDNDGFFAVGDMITYSGPDSWTVAFSDASPYVYSQSWRPGFSFLNAAELAPGDYVIRWTATSEAGNQLAQVEANARLIPSDQTAVTLDAQDACLGNGESQVVVDLNLSNPQGDVSGAQFFLRFDDTVLSYAGGTTVATDFNELQDVNVGDTINYSIFSLNSVIDDNTKLAELVFDLVDPMAEFTDLSGLVWFEDPGTGPVTNTVDQNGVPTSPYQANLGNVTNDNTAPVVSAPSAITVNADAGLCSALVDPGIAMASDTFDLTPNVVGTRDDMLPLDAPYPAGVTTTITWTATDDCGNSSTATQTVTVNDQNTLNVTVELAGVEPGPFTRCITFDLTPVGGGAPVEVTADVVFTGGMGTAMIDVPCSSVYECITARDTKHTLAATDNDDFAISGTVYVADFTSSGDGDSLIGGNLNDDTFIDILDFGIFIGQFGDIFTDANTPCSLMGFNADINANGEVDSFDFQAISTSFLTFSELTCASPRPGPNGNGDHGGLIAADAVLASDGPRTSITTRELEAMGLGQLVGSDLNRDGVLDESDISAFLGGARPDHLADVNGDTVVNVIDLVTVLEAFNGAPAAPGADVNRDGAIDIADILFVIDRL